MLFLQRAELLPKSQEYFSSANRINSFESLTIARKVLSIQIYGFLPHHQVYLLLYESCLFVIFIWYNTLNWWLILTRFVLYQLSKNLNRPFFVDFLTHLRWLLLIPFYFPTVKVRVKWKGEEKTFDNNNLEETILG